MAILLSMLPVSAIPEQLEFHTDLRVLAFMAGLSFASAALFTLAPAWRAATVALIPTLTTTLPSATSRGARRLGAWFVAGQTALSVVLLAGACLFLQSARNAMRVGPGFEPGNLLQVELERDWVRAAVGPNGRRAPYTAKQIRAAHAALEERLLAVPGVRAVTSSWIPVLPPHFVGQPQPPDPAGAFVGPRFFETLGIPIVRGRGLVDEDAMSDGAAGVVVSDSLARELFPGEDAVGKIVPSIRVRNGLFRNLQVVGIAADARLNNLRWEVDPTLYLTASSTTRPMTALQVRTSINAARVAPQVRQAIVDMDPRALVSVRSMDDSINRSIARERMVAATSGFFGLVGLVLAGIGVFGVAASAVAQRTKELGLRIALGATPWNVIRESLRDTMWVFGLGLAVGTAAAFAAARAAGSLVSGLLFGLSATDWTNVAAAAVLMVAVGAFACLTPAIRATRVDPLDALRHE